MIGLHRLLYAGQLLLMICVMRILDGEDNKASPDRKAQARTPRKEQMADIFLLLDIVLVLMVIVSGISLLIVVPRDLHKKAVLALRQKARNSRASNGRGENGQARAIPMSCGCSGSHSPSDGPKVVKG
jgi:hypothetical protein